VSGRAAGLRVQALGEDGRRSAALRRAADLPAAVAPSLPALWRGERPLALAQPGSLAACATAAVGLEARWRPLRPLAGAPFAAGTRLQPDGAEEAFASRRGSLMLT